MHFPDRRCISIFSQDKIFKIQTTHGFVISLVQRYDKREEWRWIYKDNTSTRSGTSQNTQSISNFNYITVLFRGQDHLTLADWKNGGAISYLTSLAYDSAYNFKSANTPQGTRKSGTEYNETFATRFINRSPDMSTTYKATVGSAGICSTTSSSYRFDTSTALTINGIVVNDPVGFIFLHIFRTTDTYKIQS